MYWDVLDNDVLGCVGQRCTGMCWTTMYWDVLDNDVLGRGSIAWGAVFGGRTMHKHHPVVERCVRVGDALHHGGAGGAGKLEACTMIQLKRVHTSLG